MGLYVLYWGLNKMAHILQTTIVFLCDEKFEFRLKISPKLVPSGPIVT